MAGRWQITVNKHRFYGNGSQQNNHGAAVWTIHMFFVLSTVLLVLITLQSLECLEWSPETLTYRFQIKFSQDGREISSHGCRGEVGESAVTQVGGGGGEYLD